MSGFAIRWGGIPCALLVLAVYWPARLNGLVWDDWVPLVDSPLLRDPARWRDALVSAPLNDPVAFRPLAMLSFMMQLWAGQREESAFHLFSLLVHAANVLLVVLLARRVETGRPAGVPSVLAAIFAGLAYGLHPALAEPVLWISCRYDLLMTFFLLLALLADRIARPDGWRRAGLVATAFLCAALSKETAVGFLLALPLVHLALDLPRDAPLDRAALARILMLNRRVYAMLFAAGCVYLLARWSASGASLGMERMAAQFGDLASPAQRVLAVGASLARHICDAVWPFAGMIPGRSLELPIAVAAVLPSLAGATAVTLAVLLLARAWPTARRGALLYAAFVAALLPVSNLFPLPGIFGELWVSSRYLTFPLAIACLAIPVAARLGEELSGSAGRAARRLLLAAAPLWLLFSAVAVRSAIPVWAHDGTLNTWAIRQGATQYWRYQNLGDYYLRIHAPREAREAIATAVKLRGDVALNWYYLGLAEAGLGNVTEARAAFQRALELDAGDVRSRVNLARLELAAGAPDRAAALLEGGLQYTRQPRAQPLEGLVHFLLGRSYGALGRTDDARAAFEHARQRAQTQGERAAAESELRTLPAPRP